MRQDVVFQSEGLNCAGWLYVPDDLGEDFDAYTEPGLPETAIPAIEWFERFLPGRQFVEVETAR